ncbi:MAG: DUF1844 domain-containing protein [Deltaproteobacteria bacterium]|nr:DUF1844 domain-containing protein [Deltaproteobacteria bacterium]
MAEEEQEGGRGFKVQDRRRFSPETGEPRSVEETEKGETIETKAAPQQESPASATKTRSENPSAPKVEISFASFILGLSTQALMYMGEMPPAPGQPLITDFAAAQQMIDVLAMLQQKTKGNLDAGEAAMLENALFDLRMRYVDLAKKGR